MTTDTSEKGLERLICKTLTGHPCDPPDPQRFFFLIYLKRFHRRHFLARSQGELLVSGQYTNRLYDGRSLNAIKL